MSDTPFFRRYFKSRDESPSREPASDPGVRREGHSKFVYDKDRRTIVTVDPPPATAPGAQSVELVERLKLIITNKEEKEEWETANELADLCSDCFDRIETLNRQLTTVTAERDKANTELNAALGHIEYCTKQLARLRTTNERMEKELAQVRKYLAAECQALRNLCVTQDATNERMAAALRYALEILDEAVEGKPDLWIRELQDCVRAALDAEFLAAGTASAPAERED